MTENLARLALAQAHDNYHWARVINKYWGRDVAHVEPVMGTDREGNHAMVGSLIVSKQPWPNGYPPKN